MQSSTHPAAALPNWFDPAVLVATCGGIGRIPFAPGTFGALVGVLLSVLLGSLLAPATSGLALSTASATAVEALVLVVINVAGIPLCSLAARRLGRGSDPGAIVYDEMASLPIGLLVVPAAARSPVLLVLAFLLHRLFDITKPFPCRRLEHLPAGLGIMADDWGAAVWMAASLGVARWGGLM